MANEIKPEQIPEEAVDGLRKAMFKNGTAREYIAAALNAWPGNYEFKARYGQAIALPLTPQEKTDGED